MTNSSRTQLIIADAIKANVASVTRADCIANFWFDNLRTVTVKVVDATEAKAVATLATRLGYESFIDAGRLVEIYVRPLAA